MPIICRDIINKKALLIEGFRSNNKTNLKIGITMQIYNMDFKAIVTNKIKDIYGTKRNFCEQQNYDYKSFNKKQATFYNKIDWLNKYLQPLRLKITIVDIDTTDNSQTDHNL